MNICILLDSQPAHLIREKIHVLLNVYCSILFKDTNLQKKKKKETIENEVKKKRKNIVINLMPKKNKEL